jgi:hypothetical protein
MARHAQLPYEEDVERRAQRTSDLVPDGYATSRKGHHQNVVPIRERSESRGERLPSVMSIAEEAYHRISPP